MPTIGMNPATACRETWNWRNTGTKEARQAATIGPGMRLTGFRRLRENVACKRYTTEIKYWRCERFFMGGILNADYRNHYCKFHSL